MAQIETDVTVHVNIDEYLDEVESVNLIQELKDRGEWQAILEEEEKDLENIYYALRDKDVDSAIKHINPIFNRVLGRMV